EVEISGAASGREYTYNRLIILYIQRPARLREELCRRVRQARPARWRIEPRSVGAIVCVIQPGVVVPKINRSVTAKIDRMGDVIPANAIRHTGLDDLRLIA